MASSALPKYYESELENGLKVVAIPMENGSGVITTDIFYKVGSRNEIMGKSGIAHMLEHMNFKSTKNLEAGEFDKIIKGYGGVTNASTGFDFTHYYIKSSTQNMDKSMELFSEIMKNLSLNDEEFQTERDVVAEERRWRTDNNPMGNLYFKLFNTAFTYHPYHWTPIGFMDDILNWSIEDIKDFHSMFYQPKNAIVVVAGDIDKDEVFEKSKKWFGDIKNKAEIREVYQVEPLQDGSKEIYIQRDNEVDIIALAFKIPNFEHKDQVALSAISEILSAGKSSRLIKNLVDKKKLVNQISAYNLELKDPSVFVVAAVCNNGVQAEEVKKEILKELEKIKKGKVSQKELDIVKINAKADFIFGLESSSSVADLYGGYFAKGNIEPLFKYEESLNALSLKEIEEVANRYFLEDKMSVVILK
jgi:predicted Zn-dependent peptidase